jgi:hypothetical protein
MRKMEDEDRRSDQWNPSSLPPYVASPTKPATHLRFNHHPPPSVVWIPKDVVDRSHFRPIKAPASVPKHLHIAVTRYQSAPPEKTMKMILWSHITNQTNGEDDEDDLWFAANRKAREMEKTKNLKWKSD